MIAERYQEMTKMLMVYWLWCEKEQDFPIDMDKILLAYLL